MTKMRRQHIPPSPSNSAGSLVFHFGEAVRRKFTIQYHRMEESLQVNRNRCESSLVVVFIGSGRFFAHTCALTHNAGSGDRRPALVAVLVHRWLLYGVPGGATYTSRVGC